MLVRGDKLRPDVRAEVLRMFGHRWTHENRNAPSVRMARDALRARGVEPVALVSDVAWLASHAFHVRKDGHLDKRARACEPAYMAEGSDG